MVVLRKVRTVGPGWVGDAIKALWAERAAGAKVYETGPV